MHRRVSFFECADMVPRFRELGFSFYVARAGDTVFREWDTDFEFVDFGREVFLLAVAFHVDAISFLFSIQPLEFFFVVVVFLRVRGEDICRELYKLQVAFLGAEVDESVPVVYHFFAADGALGFS
jgi:hypothetical protein